MAQKWDRNNIADQSGRIAIVTGANSGIGFETARVLAQKNAEVILACRSVEKAEKAVEQIKSQFPEAKCRVMALDLSSLESVRTFADAFLEKYDALDLLINNAGVMVPPYTKTADGFELQFGTNHIGHFALTGLLLEKVLETEGSRIVIVSSAAHKIGKINFDDLNWEKRKYKPAGAYGDSKIANLYFLYELQRRLSASDKQTISAAAHPGWTETNLQQHSGLFQSMNPLFAQSIEMGALPTLYAAVASGVQGGDYFGPSGFMEMRGYPKKVKSNKLSHNREIAKRLWAVSEELSGIKYSI